MTTKERGIWKLNFQSRVESTVLNDEKVYEELSFRNYRDKFYDLLCFEESENIRTLAKR